MFSRRMLVRVTAPPSDVITLLRNVALSVDRHVALDKVEMLEEILDSQYAARRLNFLLISIFGELSFVLATIGIYGTIAYTVSRRTHEIVICMALGARGKNVIGLMIDFYRIRRPFLGSDNSVKRRKSKCGLQFPSIFVVPNLSMAMFSWRRQFIFLKQLRVTRQSRRPSSLQSSVNIGTRT